MAAGEGGRALEFCLKDENSHLSLCEMKDSVTQQWGGVSGVFLLGSGWGRGPLGGWIGGWGRRAVACQASGRGGRTLPPGRLRLLVPLEFAKTTSDRY